MNKVILIGNLTRDPEMTTTPNGISLTRFSIAVQRNFTSANGTREADFINIVAWRKLAETCNTYLKKGNKVGVVGSMQTRTYEVDGQKRYATDIVAEEIEFLTPRGDASGYNSENAPKPKATLSEMQPMEDDDLPF